ncbi:MAG: glycosyltransferase family 4 protein [Candidatus Omnitrophica bacterium]|nr:glycosyltransferase family 4 protein [Candidatus Omnitrophota bacterium]
MKDKKKITVMLLRSDFRNCDVILGAEAVIVNIARYIDKDRIEPIVVCFTENPQKKLPLLEAVKIYGINTQKIELLFKFDVISGIIKLMKLIKKYEVDILHSHDYKSDFFVYLLRFFIKVKVITTVHGWIGNNWKVRIYEFFDSRLIKNFDKIIVVFGTLERELLKKRFQKEKLGVISNACDAKGLQPRLTKEDIYTSLKIDKTYKVIGTVGRLSPEKGHKYFIEAAHKIANIYPKVQFIIIGDGVLRQKLVKYAKELGMESKIFFVGFWPNVADYLGIFDVFVLPSLKETFGLSLLEAILMERPVISTPVGIAEEIITKGETGFLVPIKDVSALTNAIIALLDDEVFAKNLARKAKICAEKKFSIGKMINGYEEIYESIASG